MTSFCDLTRTVDETNRGMVRRQGGYRMSRLGWLRWLVVGIVLTKPQRWRSGAFTSAVVAVLVLTGASAAPAQPLAWSAPVLVDQGVPRHAVGSFGIQALSCPSVSLCVALDDLGNVLTSTNPGVISSWTVTRMRGGVVPQGLSCPSVSLCVAVGSSGDAGRVIESANPVGGAPTWRVMRVGAATDPTAVSCPSVTLCVGVDLNGDVLRSTDPTGGTQAWHVVHVDNSGTRGDGGGLSSISCPSVSLCVALGAGDVLNSTNPTAGAGAWRRVKDIAFAPAPGDSVVSCPSVSLCVVASSGSILSSTDPTGGRSAWRSLQSLALQLVNRISCPSVSLCVVGDIFGGAAISTSPTGGASAWSFAHIDGTNELNAISCPSVSLCVAVDGSGNALLAAPFVQGPAVPRVLVGRRANDEQLVAVPAVAHSARLLVDSGLAVACPPRGPACAVRGKAVNFSGSGISLGRVTLTVPAGHRREIGFTLTRRAAHLLKKTSYIDGNQLTITARAGRGAAVANTLLFGLA